MGDKDEKKKKKKSKKKEAEEAPPPEPEPEPAPAPAPAEEEEWPPKFSDEPAAPAEGEAVPPADGEEPPPADGEQPLPEGEELDEPMPIEKRKSPYPVFWNRPKAKMYGMNFDYGENYYRSMVNYLDNKSRIGGMETPRAESWAERAHKSASQRFHKQDADINDLLNTVRSNIRGYDMHHKEYTSRVQSAYGPKAY